jgi:GMP synthase-like glutamine amidotransferase
MCKCKNVKIGSYDNQFVISDLPDHMIKYKSLHGGNINSICIDRCLEQEIRYLWSQGITTTGCCCGHNKLAGYIGVIFKDIPKMKELGYIVRINEMRPCDEDSFYPKNT